MKKIKLGIAATILGLSFSMTSVAQDNKHEVSVWGAGGLSTLQYKTDMGKHKNQMGGQFGFGYTYFFTESIGLSSGLEVAFYNAKAEINQINDKYQTKDMDGTAFEYRVGVKNLKEKQNTAFLNIPIMAQYQTTGQYKFYSALGFKLGIPIRKKYKIEGADYVTSGYYSEEDFEHTNNLGMGFGEYIGKTTEEDLKLKVSFTLAAEAGMKWGLTDDLDLYTGMYVDYGLNAINKEHGEKHLVEYNTLNPQYLQANSVLHSNYHDQNGNERKVTKKVHLMSVGLKVKLAFSL